MTEAEELWTTCSDLLQEEVSEAIWRTWMSALEPVEVGDRLLVLSAPSSLVRDRLEERYVRLLEKVVTQVTGHTGEVRIIVRPAPEGMAPVTAIGDGHPPGTWLPANLHTPDQPGKLPTSTRRR